MANKPAPDQKLTENFSLYELTVTANPNFQEANRILLPEQIGKLKEVAVLLEAVRTILETPLIIHSGYRCPNLNRSVGSSDRSQHMLCEAADFVAADNVDLGQCFRDLWKQIKDEKLQVGQLIYETDQRNYGVTSWLHVSLGEPYRPKDRCNQVLRMENGIYKFLDIRDRTT